jgi:hypothetical protein
LRSQEVAMFEDSTKSSARTISSSICRIFAVRPKPGVI